MGFRKLMIVYGLDQLVAAVKHSHPDFEGSVGLPFLRELEYGGDENDFWLRHEHAS